MKKLQNILLIIIIFFACLSIFNVGLANDKIPPDGTVIIWENGRYLDNIQQYTNSNKTHACIVLYDKGQVFVYEASNPDVHRHTWKRYIQLCNEAQKEFINLKFLFFEPTNLSEEQLKRMKIYANSQLGRKFGVISFISGRPRNTIHCAEYVSNILKQTGNFNSFGPRETPKTLYNKLRKK